MRTPRSAVIAALSIGALAVGGATSAVATNDTGEEDNGAFRAASYINSDGGENENVDEGSSCDTPDQYDRQEVSTRESGKPGDNNVHNDACFLDQNGDMADGPASFQSFGVGYISACPDPDGDGPKYAVLRDSDADGRKDLCFQSGYQESTLPMTAGDDQFHTRLNARNNTGRQRVVWCSDANANGCADEEVKDRIVIRWKARQS